MGEDGDAEDGEEDEVAGEGGDVGDCGEGEGTGLFCALGGVGYSWGEGVLLRTFLGCGLVVVILVGLG